MKKNVRFRYKVKHFFYVLQNTTAKIDHIFVGIKTCEKFHKDRIPIIQNTWTKHAKHVRFYSDVFGKFRQQMTLDETNKIIFLF